MTLASALIGGTMGFAAQVFSNAIRKVPLSREPWLHAGFFVAGYWAGNIYPKMELRLVQEINEIRSSKGLLPMIGSSAWIRYQAPEDGNVPLDAHKAN